MNLMPIYLVSRQHIVRDVCFITGFNIITTTTQQKTYFVVFSLQMKLTQFLDFFHSSFPLHGSCFPYCSDKGFNHRLLKYDHSHICNNIPGGLLGWFLISVKSLHKYIRHCVHGHSKLSWKYIFTVMIDKLTVYKYT